MAKRLKIIIDALDRTSSTFTKVGKAITVLGGVAAAVGAVQLGRKLVGGMQDAVRASAEYEGAAVRLGVALRNQGQLTEGTYQGFKQYAAELSRVSIATQTQIIDALAQAKALGATDDAARRAVAAATELASATGVELDQAIRQVNKTLGGYGGELLEIIPELKELTKEQLRAGGAADIIAAKMGGAGAAGAQTFEGAVNNLRTAWNDLQVALGGPIREVLFEVIQWLIPIVDETANAAANSNYYRAAVIDTAIALVEFAKSTAEAWAKTKVFSRGLGILWDAITSKDPDAIWQAGQDWLFLGNAVNQSTSEFDELLARLERLKTTDPAAIPDLFDRLPPTFAQIVESTQTWEATLLDVYDAVDYLTEVGLRQMRLEVEAGVKVLDIGLGGSIREVLRGQGVSGALAFGDFLVDAAMRGSFEFGKFFKQLLADLARAIIQALILRAILAAVGFGGGGVAGSPYPTSSTGGWWSRIFTGGGAQRGLLVGGGIPGRDTVPIIAQAGEAVLPVELTELLMRAARRGAGDEPVELRISADIPILVERISNDVANERVVLRATELATTRTVR